MELRRFRKLSSVMSWTLVAVLTLSPVMAQAPPESELPLPSPEEKKASDAPEDLSVLMALALKRTAEPFPTVARRSTRTTIPLEPPKPAFHETKSAGESKWIILAAIIGTASAVAAILLFPGNGGGDKSPETAPIGTVIEPGTPAVNTPNR